MSVVGCRESYIITYTLIIIYISHCITSFVINKPLNKLIILYKICIITTLETSSQNSPLNECLLFPFTFDDPLDIKFYCLGFYNL